MRSSRSSTQHHHQYSSSSPGRVARPPSNRQEENFNGDTLDIETNRSNGSPFPGRKQRNQQLLPILIAWLFLLSVVASAAWVLLQQQQEEGPNDNPRNWPGVGGGGGQGNSGGGDKDKPRIFDDYFVDKFDGTNILKTAESLLPGEYAFSPSGQYRVGLTAEGDLVLEEVIFETPNASALHNGTGTNSTANATETEWFGNETTTLNETITNNITTNATTSEVPEIPIAERTIVKTIPIWNAGIQGAAQCFLQVDGNLVVKSASGQKLWSTGTHKHEGATLTVDDGGRIGVRFMESLIWMQGVPQGTYRGPSSEDLTFPVRGAFYYSWYPQTWKVSSGDVARFKPDLGYYVSGDPAVVDAHIDQLEYGKFDLGIISWFGPASNLDIARITNLMDRTLELNANIKWTLYYEDEWKLDPDHTQLQADYEYIKKWFAWHPTYAHVDGKPLLFIWNEGDCEVVDRWMTASNNEWYIIPKLFSKYYDCPVQPNNWHQYGPASPFGRFRGHSAFISPGFWHAAESTPRLPRLTESEWCNNVRRMVNTGEPWQLVTTFNEQGEGTAIESTAAHWPSASGYGYYLDCLHNIP